LSGEKDKKIRDNHDGEGLLDEKIELF